MHIAYSALRTKSETGISPKQKKELTERYEGYQTACNRYREEISAIQRYFPGWLPPFEREA